MSFKNDIGALFKEVSGQRKWYLKLGINKDQASVLKNRYAKGQLAVGAITKIMETLGYGFIITKKEEAQ